MKSITLVSFLFSILIIYSINSCAQMEYAKNAVNVAIVVYDGVETLDFAGPGEVFSDASNDEGMLCRVYTVASTKNDIVSQGFLTVKPSYSVDDAPKPDIIVIPGGGTNKAMKDEKLMTWLKKQQQSNTKYISVCTGAFVLAKTGLLDGKTATTHYCCQDDLAESFPKVKVVKNERFIDNGNVITTEGISAGIDGSLYMLEKLFGHQVALDVAKYMMYDWRPEQLNKMVNE